MRIFYGFILMLWSLQAASQVTGTERIDSFFSALEAHNRFMGSVAVMKEGKIIYTKTLGFKDAAAKTAADATTQYRIGSINKTFTTVLAMMAVDEKKLTLETTLDKFYPGIPNSGKITIAQMLSHQSGIFSPTDDSLYLQWNTQKQTEAQLLQRMISRSPVFEPGTKAAYSNSNFILMTWILEKVYKQPYAQLLQQKIIRPLGLKQTHAGGRIQASANEAYSYTYADGWKKENETDPSIPLGAGAMVSTPTDILTFADALFNGRLISPESLQNMKTIQQNFGMGLFVIPFYNKKSYGHTGGIDGFNSVFSYFPEEKIGYALTGNGSRFEVNNISIAVLSWIFSRPFRIPVFQSVELSMAELERYTGTYSSEQIPLKIVVSRKGNTLIGQAEGQPPFSLEANNKHVFSFQQAGLVMEFYPEQKKMFLKQRGAVYEYIKNEGQ